MNAFDARGNVRLIWLPKGNLMPEGLIDFHLPPVKGSAWHSRARRTLGTPPELPLVPTQELLMETPGAKPSRYVVVGCIGY